MPKNSRKLYLKTVAKFITWNGEANIRTCVVIYTYDLWQLSSENLIAKHLVFYTFNYTQSKCSDPEINRILLVAFRKR